VHRIGRTGRAGLGGTAISFCDQEEKPLLKDIQKLISKSIPVVSDHPFPLVEVPTEAASSQPVQRGYGNQQSSGRRPDSSRQNQQPKGMRGADSKQQRKQYNRKAF